MSEVKYGIIEETYHCFEKTRTSYGIAAYDVDDITVVASAHDVSVDVNEIMTLANKCNELQLSCDHLCDIVNDFLAEQSEEQQKSNKQLLSSDISEVFYCYDLQI